ncbi:TPA: site-specific integrase [Klebsiella quasipneumoniae subsp. similipneumoniae]|nr:site-specific integrase [Klebsiella quasipneumoniae subsp. similipneumoniae]
MRSVRPCTLKKALDRYCRTVSRYKRGARQEHWRITVLRRAPVADKLLHEITSVDIAAYRDMRLATINPKTGKPLSGNTVRLEMALLSDLFDIARHEWAACRENPVSVVRKPKIPPGRDRRLLPLEERKLLRGAARMASGKEVTTMIILAVETAMRQGELLALRWENINLRLGVAHLPQTKNGHPRDVPLSRRARKALQDFEVRSSGHVFRYTTNGFKSAWRRLLHATGISGLHFHDLRHEAISRLFELVTLDVMEVAAISGHRSLAMLKRYTHLKAHRLVAKLEGGRNRRMASVFVPYPVSVMATETCVTLQAPDFRELRVQAASMEEAATRLRQLLLHQLATRLRDGKRIPPPCQVPPDSGTWLMVDPLAA